MIKPHPFPRWPVCRLILKLGLAKGLVRCMSAQRQQLVKSRKGQRQRTGGQFLSVIADGLAPHLHISAVLVRFASRAKGDPVQVDAHLTCETIFMILCMISQQNPKALTQP